MEDTKTDRARQLSVGTKHPVPMATKVESPCLTDRAHQCVGDEDPGEKEAAPRCPSTLGEERQVRAARNHAYQDHIEVQPPESPVDRRKSPEQTLGHQEQSDRECEDSCRNVHHERRAPKSVGCELRPLEEKGVQLAGEEVRKAAEHHQGASESQDCPGHRFHGLQHDRD